MLNLFQTRVAILIYLQGLIVRMDAADFINSSGILFLLPSILSHVGAYNDYNMQHYHTIVILVLIVFKKFLVLFGKSL